MKAIRLFFLASSLALPLAGWAQWQWIDASGRKVFSDQPPPAEVPDKNILKRPAGGMSARVEEAAPPAPAAPKVSGKDKELEDKKKQADAAAAEKKKAEEEKLAAARAENCTRAKRAKAVVDSGSRIATSDDKGERRFMDEKEIAAESKRLQTVIDRDCVAAQ